MTLDDFRPRRRRSETRNRSTSPPTMLASNGQDAGQGPAWLQGLFDQGLALDEFAMGTLIAAQ